MKATQAQPRKPGVTNNAPYWAQKFLILGNAELAKDHPMIRKTIRRKVRMAVTFFTVCMLVAAWSKSVSTPKGRISLSSTATVTTSYFN